MKEHEYEEWFDKYLGKIESLDSKESKESILSFIPKKFNKKCWIISCSVALIVTIVASIYLAYRYDKANVWYLNWGYNVCLSFSIGLIASVVLMLYTNVESKNIGFYTVAIPVLKDRLSNMRKAYYDYNFKIQIAFSRGDYQGCYDAWHANNNTCFVILEFLKYLKIQFPYSPESLNYTIENIKNAENKILEANNRIQTEFFGTKIITPETVDVCRKAMDYGAYGLSTLDMLISELKLNLYGIQYGKHKNLFKDKEE